MAELLRTHVCVELWALPSLCGAMCTQASKNLRAAALDGRVSLVEAALAIGANINGVDAV